MVEMISRPVLVHFTICALLSAKPLAALITMNERSSPSALTGNAKRSNGRSMIRILRDSFMFLVI